jgi:HD-GYP domain-containing protein (c-di-GMP phosphodiesterase class II)
MDYEGILRDVAKAMVRLKKPARLLKMITRFIDKNFQLEHTSILFWEESRSRYAFLDSKGRQRIPAGFVKFDRDHPLISWFSRSRRPAKMPQDYLLQEDLEGQIEKNQKSHPDAARALQLVLKSMRVMKAQAVIPAYFKNELLGLLLLGAKKNGKSFDGREINFFQTVVQDCSMAVKTAEYHQSLLDRNQELQKQLREIESLRVREQKRYYEIIRSLAQQVHAKDPYTFGHIGQVERLGVITGRELGLDMKGRCKDILSAGLLLHDVGKIGIPDHILNKPARLDAGEWEIMKTHVEKGAQILEPLTDFKEVREIVYSHHERWDGTGYPRQLKGDEIPIGARIVSVVDAFHAIVSTRCYSQGRPIETAFEELRRCAGTQFDPQVVEAFISALTKEMKRRGTGFFYEGEAAQHA